ncbi:MAG: LysM peptidoglycan-binding domain-containing protein, partial [Proteobacteria bacterium]|nr:LysM peptidoglycan-binding domain-containing protein [Pseudomonadota bacterium]
MRQRQKDLRSLPVLKFVGAALIAGLTGACSSDVMRFSDTPFANPFAGRADTTTTGSINAPSQSVRASALGMPKATASSWQPFPGNETPVVSSVSQVAAASPVTGSVAGWTAAGGTPVMMRSGDTIEALSTRYGVPTSALRQINGLSGKAQPASGQQLIIPAYNPTSTAKKASTLATQKVAEQSPRYEALAQPVKAKAEAASKPRYLPLPSETSNDDEEDDSK